MPTTSEFLLNCRDLVHNGHTLSLAAQRDLLTLASLEQPMSPSDNFRIDTTGRILAKCPDCACGWEVADGTDVKVFELPPKAAAPPKDHRHCIDCGRGKSLKRMDHALCDSCSQSPKWSIPTREDPFIQVPYTECPTCWGTGYERGLGGPCQACITESRMEELLKREIGAL